ncbi:MAG: hypothetical protein CVU44_22965 [Chloroflexi bacterium HGW-Chloroflexi-6]|nr:MAG: hypothetical protein CVU44_22965 [Chloroflexi bacterium HGW-Chloroflexi-6]
MIAALIHLLLAQAQVKLLATHLLIVEKNTLPLRGPETESECAKEWRELIAKQAREESELLAERLEM